MKKGVKILLEFLIYNSSARGRRLTSVSGSSLTAPAGYAFVIQNNRIVTQSGKPVIIRKAS